ncbi:MAG: Uma2 family endonuclease [Kovacikia sp.]
MPPPQLVVEFLSPGKQNRDRALIHKRDQHSARDLPEYWLVNPETQTMTVLQLQNGSYGEVERFQANEGIVSPMFPELQLTAA